MGSFISGGTYSTANFVCGAIADLVAHPEVLAEIREEIYAKHYEINGSWDQAALDNLHKLDSAMMETSRLSPGSLLVYSRIMEKDYILSNGIRLKNGQTITMSGHSKAIDPSIFHNVDEYHGLRFYDQDRHKPAVHPFKSIDGDVPTWGAGHWACPGRIIANMTAKVALVKMLDGYDFKHTGGKRPPNLVFHEFVVFHPFSKLLVRKRKERLGIHFG